MEDTDGRYRPNICLLYTSDAADERSSVDLGGRRTINKKKKEKKKEPDTRVHDARRLREHGSDK